MVGTDPGSAREEAERLVATALAAVRLATAGGGLPGSGPFGAVGDLVTGVLGGRAGGSGHPSSGRFATGAPECCVCPLCRAVAALRDPSPEFAERLATGAGDLAAGLASLMRAFSAADGGGSPAPAAGPDPAGSPAGSHPATGTDAAGTSADTGRSADTDQVWRSATRTGHDSQPAPDRDVWAAATSADVVDRPRDATPPADDAGPATVRRTARPAGPPAATPPTDGPDPCPAVAVSGPGADVPADDGAPGDRA